MTEEINKWLYAFKFIKAPLLLLQLLYATDTSRANKQVVHPLLAANLEKLDEHLLQVLRHQLVRTLPNTLAAVAPFPEQGEAMAAMFLNLGNLIVDFPQGNRAINLEIAIQCQQIALTFFNRQSFAPYWANCQNDLGNSYLFRIWGEKGENLEEAIRCFKAALEVHTPETNIEVWAKILVNLGGAYLYRIRGKKADNLKEAIQCLSDALEVLNPDNFHSEWIQAKTNLSMAYIYRIGGENVEDVEIAIRCLLDIAEVVKRETEPEEWAENQRLLSFAYVNRIRGNEAENWKTSIGYSSSTESVSTRNTFPEIWAKSRINQGVAYLRLNRIHPRHEENVEQAIRCLEDALQVCTREAFPQEYIITQFYLGIVYQEDRQFQNAYTAFATAIDTIESLRGEIVLGSRIEEYKLKLAEEWNNLYQRMVEVCVELSNPVKAIEYVERSKTRNLVELILNRDLKSIFSPDVVSQLEKLQNKIADGQYQIQSSTANNPTVIVQHLQEMRSQRNKLQDKYLPIGHGFNFDQFRLTLDERTTIIEFYITTKKLLVFVITRKNLQPLVLPSERVNLGKFLKWANAYLRSYRNRKLQWQRRLKTRLHLLAKILHLDEIIKQIPSECDRLIFIPHRYLHLFPLHALPFTSDTSLFDRFSQGVSYIPSCQLLQLAQTRQRAEFTHLFAIQNPTGDLTYTDIEVEAIVSYFNTTNILKQKTATRKAIDEASLTTIHCAHFSCHGYFNAAQPRNSALILANTDLSPAQKEPDLEYSLSLPDGSVLDLKQCLTLDAIFALNLDRCRLVTLSACETGLIDFENISDEYIGLPSGFIYAGSSNVVSSLWKVEDISTALLMIRFYQNLKAGSTVARALNTAQNWMRNSTQSQLLVWSQQLALDEVLKQEIKKSLDWFYADEQPFAEPQYWAGFCAVGC